MKLVHVIHDFLPRHQAGSELYCYHISKQLQALGHEVHLFFTEIDHNQPNYSVRDGVYDGLPFREIINNHAYASFAETYQNPAIEAAFAALLDDFQPDTVHFHHLLSLSYGCVDLCKRRGIPTVFTLHDYWLTCPRGGQRFRGNEEPCERLVLQACGECISRYSVPSGWLARGIKKALRLTERIQPPSLLHSLAHGKIQVPDRAYVSLGQLEIEGITKAALFAHPPCRIEAKVPIPAGAQLALALCMTPSTYTQPGKGVRFRIACEGQTLFEQVLHPKENSSDRGWKQVLVPMEGISGKKKLVFETQVTEGNCNDFCSAAWGDPQWIHQTPAPFQSSWTSKVRALGETLLSRVQRKRLLSLMEKRVAATQALFTQVDCFIAPSRFLRETMIRDGIPADKIIFSDYGIAVPAFSPVPRGETAPLRFTYIGTFVEHKGVHVLIEAFHQIPQGKAVLNLYGDLTEFSGYVKRIQSMISHPGIALRGRAENQQIPSILDQTDVLIVPSIWFENSPITIHEAFLAGVPVITSNYGGMANLVRHEKNGLLFEKGSPQSLAQCLLRCVNEPGLVDQIKPNPASVKTIVADADWLVRLYTALHARQPLPSAIDP